MRFLRGQAADHVSRGFALRRLFKLVRRKDTPQARGRALLREWLTPEQCAQFDAFGYFDVTGGVSGKRYRIHFGISANVQELDEGGSAKEGWCFAPRGNLVAGDVMLAQKIVLETTELVALATANRFPVTPAIPILRRRADRRF